MEQFGGHKYAAGLTLKKENLEAFTAKFESVVADTIQEEMLIPQVSIDAVLNLADIDHKLYRILRQMAPFGPGNMSPVFMSKQVVGQRLWAKDRTRANSPKTKRDGCKSISVLDCIGFGMADKFELIKDGQQFDIAYALEENEWNGNINLQLRLKDIRN